MSIKIKYDSNNQISVIMIDLNKRGGEIVLSKDDQIKHDYYENYLSPTEILEKYSISRYLFYKIIDGDPRKRISRSSRNLKRTDSSKSSTSALPPCVSICSDFGPDPFNESEYETSDSVDKKRKNRRRTIELDESLEILERDNSHDSEESSESSESSESEDSEESPKSPKQEEQDESSELDESDESDTSSESPAPHGIK